jgi:polyisoprenyl-teichoic acid--peptidoglycan teichoic acid transferase
VTSKRGGLRSPVTAATLSLLFPGLGQYASGDHRRGLLIAIPALVLLTGLIGFGIGTVLGGGADAVIGLVFRPEVLVAVVAVDIAFLAYHGFSIIDAWFVARRAGVEAGRRTGPLAFAGLAAILAVAILAHGTVAALGMETEDTLAAVFQGDTDTTGDWEIPQASFEPDDRDLTPSASPDSGGGVVPPLGPATLPSAVPGATPTPSPVPVPNWAKDGRLNLLLVGSDAGQGRWLQRTDTMIVLSVDVASGDAAMFGIPRNLINVPLAPEDQDAIPGGRFPGLLNALYVYAWGHPGQFPGGDARGFRAVTGAIQELVGVPLDGFVAVDLRGFAKIVNALGGLKIRIPAPVYDNHYPKVDGSGYTTLSFQAGCQELNGTQALAYARSRHQDSDYGRMGRQQLVLLALRRELDPLDVLEKAPQLLSIAKDDLWTTIKRKDLPSLAQLATKVGAKDVQKVLFAPPAYPEVMTTSEIKQIRKTVRHVFDDAGSGGGGGGGGNGIGKPCP